MPVEMTTAQAAPRRRTPTYGGTRLLAAMRTTLPPSLGIVRSSWSLNLLKAKTAMTTTTVSTNTVPTVQKITAFLASLGVLAL